MSTGPSRTSPPAGGTGRRNRGAQPGRGPGSLRVFELYCGIGGCAAALDGAAEVVAAIDIDRRALEIYGHNFPGHPTLARTIEGLSAAELAGFRADLWWLSPPCQPYTRRGLGRDDQDPRAASLHALLDRLEELGPEAPRHVALENVPAFQGSRCHRRLLETLDRAGYRHREGLLCPTELGVPNKRRRYYLVASREGEPADWISETGAAPPTDTLRPYLDGEAGRERRFAGAAGHGLRKTQVEREGSNGSLSVDPDLVRRYRHALDIVHPDESGAVTACFTAAYGRSPVRSGSYLALNGHAGPAEPPRLRRFSPTEILRLLGFPASYRLPSDLPPEKAWPLAGNSLSIPAVRRVLSSLPELAGLRPART